MNTESIQCRQVTEITQVGDFCYDDEFSHIYIWIPGMTGPDAIRIHKGADRGIEREWSWDGNESSPTLSPSIHAPGQWHGYLRAGKLESC